MAAEECWLKSNSVDITDLLLKLLLIIALKRSRFELRCFDKVTHTTMAAMAAFNKHSSKKF